LAAGLQDTLRQINASLSDTLGASGEVGRHLVCCPAPASNPVRAAMQEVRRHLATHLLPQTRAYHEVWLDGDKVYDGQSTAEPGVAPSARRALPQHFKIGMAAPGDNCIDVYTHDLGLVAVARHGALQGFNILIGGGMGMTPHKPESAPRLAEPLGFVSPSHVMPTLEHILALRQDYGARLKRPQVRFKSVVATHGVGHFRAALEQRLGAPLQKVAPMPALHLDLHLGWHAQDDARWYLGLSIENGRIEDRPGLRLRTGLRHIVAAVRPQVRLTPNQDVLLTDLSAEQRTTVERLLQEHGIPLPHDFSLARRYAMACPALPTCGHAVAEAERALPAIMAEIDTAIAGLGLQDECLTIRMTGCSYGCTRPYVADLAFVGMASNQYAIYVGGRADGRRLNQLFAERVVGQALVTTVLPLLRGYQRQRKMGEGFGDFCTRLGMEALRHLADASRDQPAHG
jgi:sulfite reductase (ferredoxin)